LDFIQTVLEKTTLKQPNSKSKQWNSKSKQRNSSDNKRLAVNKLLSTLGFIVGNADFLLNKIVAFNDLLLLY
jgi:hypothetical protein